MSHPRFTDKYTKIEFTKTTYYLPSSILLYAPFLFTHPFGAGECEELSNSARVGHRLHHHAVRQGRRGYIHHGLQVREQDQKLEYAKNQYQKFETNIPRKWNCAATSQFPYSCVCVSDLYILTIVV